MLFITYKNYFITLYTYLKKNVLLLRTLSLYGAIIRSIDLLEFIIHTIKLFKSCLITSAG